MWRIWKGEKPLAPNGIRTLIVHPTTPPSKMCPSDANTGACGSKTGGSVSESDAAGHKADINILCKHQQMQYSIIITYNFLHTVLFKINLQNSALLVPRHMYVYRDLSYCSGCRTEISVSAPRTCWDNNAEICGSYVKHCTHKLQKSACVGVTKVIQCITVHGRKECTIKTNCHYQLWREVAVIQNRVTEQEVQWPSTPYFFVVFFSSFNKYGKGTKNQAMVALFSNSLFNNRRYVQSCQTASFKEV
jgi:hypothetical protein